MYVAQKMVYFQDENIEVEFLEGVKGVDFISPGAKGEVTFDIASSAYILIRRTKGGAIQVIAAISR